MDIHDIGRSRPGSSTPPIGSPTFNGFLDNIPHSYRSINQFRSSSPVGDALGRRQSVKPAHKSADENPLVKRNIVDYSPDDQITHLVAGHNKVAIATKDKKILLIDTKTSEQSICDIAHYYGSRLWQIKIYRLFLDPTGKFLLISVAFAKDGMPYENLIYIKQLQSLQKLKNHLISSVAWNYPRATSSQQQSQLTGTLSTGTILLGTSKGLVLQTEFTQSDETKFFPLKIGPGHYVKEIFDVGPEAGAITGIEYHQINNNNLATERSFVILLSTNNRLYRMVGNASANVDPPPLQLIMTQNSSNYTDVPGRFMNSKLDVHYPSSSPNSIPTRFAWLTEPGIMTGELYEHLTECRSTFESNEDINMIPYTNPEELAMPISSSVPSGYSPQSGVTPYKEKPISLVVTNFHVVILMRFCIRVICILNNLTVYEDIFPKHDEVQGMSKDPVRNIIYVYFTRMILRYRIPNENKHIWKIFLDQKRYDLAKRYSSGDKSNFDRVICEEALHYFKMKEYEKSAEIFARSKKSFEDVSVMFLEVNRKKALRKYLMIRLDEFENGSIQQTMALYWLFELIISSITILESEKDKEQTTGELEELNSELTQLLDCKQVVDCLRRHPNIFYGVIQNYANYKIYIRVATLIGDHDHLMRAHMYTKEYDEALGILRDLNRVDLFYLHGHLLMKHRPKEFVDALIEQPKIDPSKLIPILMQENPYYNKCCETIRYLEYCVNDLRSDCRIIHNTLFDLYARYRKEDLLIDYLKREIGVDSSQLCYLDLQSCLRVCTGLKLFRTCVVIYSHMNLHDEAVNLALEFDVELAKSIVKQVESDDHQKRLWLAIAKKVLTQKAANIEVAAQLLDESKLLKIEDVLIFFPEYKSVDTIETALHQSLQAKRNEILSIRDGTYEIIANEIRSEIKTFKVRYSKLKCGQKCEICSQNIMLRPLYLFPCGHLFHYDCIIKEIISIDPQYHGIEEKLRLLSLEPSSQQQQQQQQQQKLTSSFSKQQSISLNSFSSQDNKVNLVIDKEKIINELHEITSKECIYCGGFLANYIDKPAPKRADL